MIFKHPRARLRLAALLAVLAAFAVGALAQKPIRDLKPTVILVSLDGFRYDYIDKFRPSVIEKLAKVDSEILLKSSFFVTRQIVIWKLTFRKLEWS